MNIEQAKSISLINLLSKLGIEPVSTSHKEAWYISPFRDEKTPSFKVNVNDNTWVDFGEDGKRHDIVNFACGYLKKSNVSNTVSDALRFIQNIAGETPRIQPIEGYPSGTEAPKFAVVLSKAIKSPALDYYLEKRGITMDVARQYLEEVRVRNKETGNTFFALGLKNEDSGYELRNPGFKGTAGRKNISFVRGKVLKPEAFHMFEGMMDFLSIVSALPDGRLDEDAIILNSLSCLEKATGYIKGYGYRVAYTYMDNDDAGKKATQSLKEFFETEKGLEHRPMNELYKDFKDVNEWHVSSLGPRPS